MTKSRYNGPSLLTNNCKKMPDKKKQVVITSAVSAAVIILAALVIWRVAFFTPAAQLQTHVLQSQIDHNHKHLPSTTPAENKEEAVKKTEKSAKTDIERNAIHKWSLNDVINAARTWRPAYIAWFGRKAPDFTLTDINGKKHQLSDYRGKDVMIIFWASWCGPCIIEVPHLIALRNTIGKDKLAMLAISNENPALVKQFAAYKKINYTVITAGTTDMPEPYNRVRSIPSSFFIDSEGKIKLATSGLLSLGEIKAILQAK